MGLSWTQPLCFRCWDQTHDGREPVVVKDADMEKCCRCGVATFAGIYVRVDPRAVRFPTEEEEERDGNA